MAKTGHNYKILAALLSALAVFGVVAAVWSTKITSPVAAAESVDEWPNALAPHEAAAAARVTTTTQVSPTTEPQHTTTTALDFSGDVGYVAKALIEDGFVGVWSEPDEASEPSWSLAVPTEFFGPRYFQVIGEQGEWLEVAVPVRPNGTTGWIPRDAVTLSPVDTTIVIDLSDRELTVTQGGDVVARTTVAIGKDGTPTPIGSFYLRDELPWDEASVYGPFVLALSAYSDSIDQINGGDAVVAIHGTTRPDLLGQQASLGCVRVENDEIRAIADVVEPGTPVEIVA